LTLWDLRYKRLWSRRRLTEIGYSGKNSLGEDIHPTAKFWYANHGMWNVRPQESEGSFWRRR
ncbi:hypothetical protein, partial [Sulfobacillus thermosulfidooxidans]